MQGVWYRQSCRRQAAARGVCGWVANHADGTVEAVLEGDDAAVGEVLAWMEIGPAGAMVTSVNTCAETPVGEGPFVVR